MAAGDKHVASRLVPLMKELPPISLPLLVSSERLLAKAYVLLGQPEEARASFQQAIVDTEKVEFRPELALAHLGLAELLLDHYPDDRDEATEHLDAASPEFQDLGMGPSLERALGLRDTLKA